MTAIDFTISTNGALSFTKNTREMGSSEGFSYKLYDGVLCTPSGYPLTALVLDGEAWPAHTVNGTATATYAEFQDLLRAEGFSID